MDASFRVFLCAPHGEGSYFDDLENSTVLRLAESAPCRESANRTPQRGRTENWRNQ
jgi:hypothetical protein